MGSHKCPATLTLQVESPDSTDAPEAPVEAFIPETIVRETWISKRPDSMGFVVSAAMTFLLALGSIIYWRDLGHALSWMPASYEAIFDHHSVWRAWSSLFAHADEKHLLGNSFLFFILGSFLSGYFGVLMFPLMAFVFGGFIQILVVLKMNPEAQLLGASGIVFWMGGVWLSLYFLLDIKRSLYQRSLRALGVGLLLFFPAEAFDPQVSYRAHLIGFAIGILWGITYYFLRRRTFIQAIQTELVLEQ